MMQRNKLMIQTKKLIWKFVHLGRITIKTRGVN